MPISFLFSPFLHFCCLAIQFGYSVFTCYSPLLFLKNSLQENQLWCSHETWTSNYTWLEKQNNFKKYDDDVISVNCNVTVMLPICGQFGAIQKPYSGGIVCKTYIFINSNFLSYKNRTKKSLTQLSHSIGLSKGTIFAKNYWNFAKEMLASAKLRRCWY